MRRLPISKRLLNRCRELRSSSTRAERRLWSRLRGWQLHGFKFRRQHPVGTFIVDFYCHEAKLAIEIDGGQHAEENQSVYDEKRTADLQGKGITVLRFWNIDVLRNVQGVLETIAEALSTLTPKKSHKGGEPRVACRWVREQEAGDGK